MVTGVRARVNDGGAQAHPTSTGEIMRKAFNPIKALCRLAITPWLSIRGRGVGVGAGYWVILLGTLAQF